jgi:hypothetical protein
MLFETGKNIRQVCDWLGHADPAFTLRTYVHLTDGGLGDAEFSTPRHGATPEQHDSRRQPQPPD